MPRKQTEYYFVFPNDKNGLIRKLKRTIMQRLKKVPAINNEVYTSFLSSSRLIILLAAGCCLVFKRLMSFVFKEKIKTDRVN